MMPNEKKSNGDIIRAMSDEQLALFLNEYSSGDIDTTKTFCNLCDREANDCDECTLWWVRNDCTLPQGLRYFDCDKEKYDVQAANVMEVKHGEWLTRKDYEDNYQTYACSICDNSCVTSHNEDDTVTLYRTKYCPNCGAKMDKGVY